MISTLISQDQALTTIHSEEADSEEADQAQDLGVAASVPVVSEGTPLALCERVLVLSNC